MRRLDPSVLCCPILTFFLAACGADSPTGSKTDADTTGLAPLVTLAGVPEGWSGTTGSGGIGLTGTERHGGSAALYVSGPAATVPISSSSVILVQSIKADNYRGKRIRWSAWVKPRAVTDASYSGLWMRVDGPGMTIAFDNMSNRPTIGSGDWRQVSVVLDVAPNAIGIALGVLFSAHNTLLLDDMTLEVVGTNVPSTNTISGPLAPTSDSATVAANYARVSDAPSNLDFEGLPGPATQTVDWLSRTAVPLATTDPAASIDDIEPLRAMVGSAHVVGLGEGTHGTREFFQMKHRILKFLVTRMGFTHFAIEATSPESDDMNRYVLDGDGDPVRLLSRLYFWTWNTQEVMDMVRWMREWNSTAPANQKVQFLGFDMQFPGASIDSVTSYLGKVDRAAQATVMNQLSCIAPYRNDGPTFARPSSQYAALSDAVKSACAASLQQIYNTIKNGRAAYVAATSPAIYESMLHHARLVQQFESMVSIANASASSQSRDASMAENIVWLRDQAGPSAKIALWAHNGHINSVPKFMGGYLRSSYASDYVNLGFAFGRGTFTAVGQSGTTFTGLGTWSATVIPKSSIEAVFEATDKPRLLLDTRLIVAGGAAAAPLGGPISMRSIGSVFQQGAETAYFSLERFPDDFDLLIYLSSATASVRLPFIY